MPTTYYFHNTNAATGPTAKASTDTDSFPLSPADKNTPKDMDKNVGASVQNAQLVANSASSPLYGMIRIFVGPALQAGQAITVGQAVSLNIGISESNAQMNLFARVFAYVWRSGTGNVKTLMNPTSATEEHTSATATECTTAVSTVPAGAFSTALNDRVVVETWADIRNTKATNYTATNYYDGTDTVFVDNTATASAGSHFIIGTDTLLAEGEISVITVKRMSDRTVRHNRRSGTTQYIKTPAM